MSPSRVPPEFAIKNDVEFEKDLANLKFSGETLRGTKLTELDFFSNLSLSSEQRELATEVNHHVDQVAASVISSAETPSLLGLARTQDLISSLGNTFRRLIDDVGSRRADDEITRLDDNIYDCKLRFEIVKDQIAYFDSIIVNHTEEPPVLPEIKPAPIQSVIKDDILALTSTQNRSGSIDYPSANRVRDALRRILHDVVDDLKSSSNADRGYIRICERLLAGLTMPIENASIEDLGVQCQLVERSTRRLAEELGSIILDQIEHVIAGVGVLLNQFDEWQKFLDEQARTNLDPEDGDGLVARAEELVAELEKPGAPVEPELVRRLRGMVEPALTGIVGADTVAIPLVCSLSNIFSTLSQYAIDHYQSLSPGVQHAALAGSVALMARFAVDIIEKFSPVLSKYQPLAFIISVVRYLLPQYSQSKDATG